MTTCFLLIGGLVLIHLKLQAYAYDDAYIHFRIAENLITYGVPNYNPQEEVMVSSSSGWTLILAGLAIVARLSPSLNLPTLTAVFNGIVTGTGALIYLRLLQHSHSFPQRIIVEIFFVVAYLSQMIKPSLGLMETPVAILLAGIALLGLLRKKTYSYLLVGMLRFFRPELILLSGLAAGYALIVQRVKIGKLALIILGSLPFTIFNLSFFSSLIPNTIQAKSIVYTLSSADTIDLMISKIIDDVLFLRFIFSFSELHLIFYAFLIMTVVTSSIVIHAYKLFRQLVAKK